MPKEYPVELLQVAAVAVAAYQGYISLAGKADCRDLESLDAALRGIVIERGRQDEKWGPQTHTPEEWIAILVEELGEAAQAVNQMGGR